MRKYKFVKNLRREISRVNEEIDKRIIRGYSYKELAKKHKVLISKLNSANRFPSSSFSFLNTFNRVVSTLMF